MLVYLQATTFYQGTIFSQQKWKINFDVNYIYEEQQKSYEERK